MKTRLGLSFWRSQNLKKKGGGKENTNRVNETLIKINLKQKRKEKKTQHTQKSKAQTKKKNGIKQENAKGLGSRIVFSRHLIVPRKPLCFIYRFVVVAAESLWWSRGGGGRDEVWDRETMFSQLAKRSPSVVVSG